MLRTAQKGFTLIELVIVVVIIGILAAAAMPKYMDLTGSAKTAASNAGGMAVQTAFAGLIGQNAATNPSAPYPTLANLKTAVGDATALTTGVCVATGYAIKTFADAAGTTPTAATGNSVRQIDKAPTVDAGCP